MAFYHKYRPQTFSNLVGQDHIKKTLQGALVSNQVSHAYLFTGPRGLGKTTTARLLAKAVNCLGLSSNFQKQVSNPEPCNQCQNCLEISQGRSLDVIEIDAASNRGIDEIRDLREKIRFAPTNSRYKVYIIDETHQLTREAFNALLKTLEEPPSHAIFILVTTQPTKVPPTITSRSQRFDFKLAQRIEIIKILKEIVKAEKIEAEDSALNLIAQAASGSFRDAESLLEQVVSHSPERKITQELVREILGLVRLEAVEDLISKIALGQTDKALKRVGELAWEGVEMSNLASSLIEFSRLLLLEKTASFKIEGMTQEQKQKITQIGSKFSTSQILDLIDQFVKADWQIKSSSIPSLPIELAVVTLAEKMKGLEQDSNSEKIWSEILTKIKPANHSLYGILKETSFLGIKEEKIVLATSFPFHCEKILQPKNRAIIEEGVKEIIGKDYKITCTVNPPSREFHLLEEVTEIFES